MRRSIVIALGIMLGLAGSRATMAQVVPGAVTERAGRASVGVGVIGAPEIDASFRLLYELKFAEARDGLTAWERGHSEDPLGPAAEAASYLFEEFYRQGVLTSDFFLDDKQLLGGIKGKADPGRSAAFSAAIRRANDLGAARLKTNPQDANALFAVTMTSGLSADYSSIIAKHQLESLHETREAEDYSKRLLAVKPDAADALLAPGMANYIVACMPAHKRLFLWFGGIHGDKAAGMKELGETATHGHFLRPFAKMMLALADLREKQTGEARELLQQLADEFPQNELFRRELGKLDSASHKAADE